MSFLRSFVRGYRNSNKVEKTCLNMTFFKAPNQARIGEKNKKYSMNLILRVE